MTKFYAFGFWILLISTITFLNFWQVTKSGCEKENIKWKKINEKRIFSLITSNSIAERSLNSFSGKNIISNEIINNLSKDTTLVILLSEPKCNKCQEKELKRLNILKEKIGGNGVQIIGITTKAKKNDLGIQRKITKIEFPIYWVADTTFFNHLAFDSEFPQILYIVDGIVLSAFKPVPMDDEFSENYYEQLLSVIVKNK